MEKITSTKNPVVKAMRDLKDKRAREESGRILVEGEVMIREALGCGLAIHELLADERHESFALEMEAQGARAFGVPRSILETVCESKTPQGVCASFDAPKPLQLLSEGHLVPSFLAFIVSFFLNRIYFTPFLIAIFQHLNARHYAVRVAFKPPNFTAIFASKTNGVTIFAIFLPRRQFPSAILTSRAGQLARKIV